MCVWSGRKKRTPKAICFTQPDFVTSLGGWVSLVWRVARMPFVLDEE